MIKQADSVQSLDALQVFSKAAKHMNFTHAAHELGITQAAVSRRIHKLEQQLGKPLFIRTSKRRLKLTQDGEKLFQVVTQSLASLETVISEIQNPKNEDTISVTSTSGFATLWLMPRLAQFNETHPEIKIRLVLVDELLDLNNEAIDLGIRYGSGQWANLESKLLFAESLYPVCSPHYLDQHPQITDLNELINNQLLHVEEKVLTAANWSRWLAEFDIQLEQTSSKIIYNNYPLLVQSCLNHQGILLGWHHMIYDLISSGELVRPVQEILHTENGFYMITPKDKTITKNVKLFIDWIFNNAKQQSQV